MEYQCCDKQETWTSSFKNLVRRENGFEVDVSGRGSSFHIIVGEYQDGNYLCIPSLRISCVLAEYDDSFWNREQLEDLVGTVDAITIVNAIKTVSCLIKDAVE